MSKNSKAKRDKKRKQQGKRPFQRLNRDIPVENHAVMQDEEGRVVAAIGPVSYTHLDVYKRQRMKKLLIAASLSLAVSAPAIAAGPQQGKFLSLIHI